MPYQIEILRDQCITAESCVVRAPRTFAIDEEGIAVVIDPAGDADEEVLAAAKECPVECIIVRDDSGEQIWPED